MLFIVVGWDGQKSLLSKSMDDDRKRMNAKSLDEEYDDEFDEGRVSSNELLRTIIRKNSRYCYNANKMYVFLFTIRQRK